MFLEYHPPKQLAHTTRRVLPAVTEFRKCREAAPGLCGLARSKDSGARGALRAVYDE
jgi:hypothetical protein